MADCRSPEQAPPIATILWAGAVLTALGIAGYLLDPRLAFVWAIFLFFGIATVPQVLSMTIAHRLRGQRELTAWWQLLRRRGKGRRH